MSQDTQKQAAKSNPSSWQKPIVYGKPRSDVVILQNYAFGGDELKFPIYHWAIEFNGEEISFNPSKSALGSPGIIKRIRT